FWNFLEVDQREIQKRLTTTCVSLRSFGNIPTQDCLASLKSLGIKIADQGDIEIVITDDYLRQELAQLNQKALQLQRPWLLVKPVGTVLWIGPLFHPGKTGCWNCLAQRLRTNRPVETYIQKQKNSLTHFQTSIAALPSTLQAGFNIVVTEIIKWIIQGENPQIEETLVTLDTLSLKTETHKLVRRPQCPCCGEPDYLNQQPLPIFLKSKKKIFTSDGGHRCYSPEETLKKYEHHISPITGVVHTLQQKNQEGNTAIHSYYAGHNFAMMFDSLYFLRQTVRGKSGGKGKTDIQAKASALCEAIERYSGIFQGDEIRHQDTYLNLGTAAIDLKDCLNFSEEQYKTRANWNTTCELNQQVPEPFDEKITIEWTPIWSLTHQEFKYLPTAYCYYGYPRKQNPFCWADSNGAAAGNTKEEAIFQGFMELVERDGVALWWYNRISRPAVNLESFDEPYFQTIVDYYRTINRELWVLDITSDLNIPTFVAISRRTDQPIEDIIFGFGTHFDPKIAVLRAITEANQILPAVSTIAMDGRTHYRFSDRIALNWWQTATLANQPYLAPDTSLKPKVASDYNHLWSDDLQEDVLNCVKLAEKQGLEVLVLDQTRPDIGLDVVKVIVPGMRHFWRRLAPGRLYEVPVKLGWLSKPLTENQLNPFPMFL
ncbi:MAG TPA: TOMM precursor leader peptide-binding protein, partial [Cyanophyceae cyanobacterium]